MELAYLWPSFNNGFSLYDLLTPAQLELSRQMVRVLGRVHRPRRARGVRPADLATLFGRAS